MSLGSRAPARTLLRLLTWPFTGEVKHVRPSPERAEQPWAR